MFRGRQFHDGRQLAHFKRYRGHIQLVQATTQREDPMPTYPCSIAAGRLTPARKMDIVRCITTVHHEETGAPRYLSAGDFLRSGKRQSLYRRMNWRRLSEYGSEAIFGAGGLRNRKARSFAGSCKASPSPLMPRRRQSGSISWTSPQLILPSADASCRFREMRISGSRCCQNL